MVSEKPKPLAVITGPTASGKSSLALKLAKKYSGEIICADSRTVYKGMDVGTAKPTPSQQKEVKHHLLDVIEAGQIFTAAEFKRLAILAIKDIRKRNKIPFLVGGTGLYIDSVVFDYQFGPKADAEFRNKLEYLELERLWEECEKHNISLPDNKYNRRHVIRAIERQGINYKRREKPIDNCFIVGISTERSKLRERIAARAQEMFNLGVVAEAARLSRSYGWESEAMTANIYRLARMVIENQISETEAKEKFITLDWRLAKRQLTWLKRNPYIKWHDLKSAEQYISRILEPRHTG